MKIRPGPGRNLHMPASLLQRENLTKVLLKYTYTFHL